MNAVITNKQNNAYGQDIDHFQKTYQSSEYCDEKTDSSFGYIYIFYSVRVQNEKQNDWQ